MKDEFDTYTKEMFGKNPVKPIVDADAKQFAKLQIEEKKATKGGGGAMPKSNRDITKNYKAGGKVSSASKRADGCCAKGKTKGKMR